MTPETEAVWSCTVSGPALHADLPGGGDFPMRQAVRAAYRTVTGQDATDLSSGWGMHRALPPEALRLTGEMIDVLATEFPQSNAAAFHCDFDEYQDFVLAATEEPAP